MLRHLIAVGAALLISCVAPTLHAQQGPALGVTLDVSHVTADKWRVEYHFLRPVTAIRLDAVANYRRQAWKIITPGLVMKSGPQFDVISSRGKPFTVASVEITAFDGFAPKQYAPLNRFTDGGTALFLGHLQGDASQGKHSLTMSTEIRLKGLPAENVIAPPPNKAVPGGERGYAYFGPAQVAPAGATLVLIDAKAPPWVRETMLGVGATMSAYYEKAYERPLKDPLFIMLSISGFDSPGLSMKGGAVLGQLSYRFEGKQILGDHPRKREHLARLVAHEMAHIWQLNIARGGIGGDDPWIYEGGAEAMALDALLQTGAATPESVAAYRAAQSATCEKLGNTVASYEGIYACGLVRFEKLGVGIVPLWRAMMQSSEATGEVYSVKMIDAIAAGK